MLESDSKPVRLRKFIPQPDRYAAHYGNFALTPRDIQILKLVCRYRYLEARHIRALTAGSDQQITRRLQGLFHNKYLARYLPHTRMRLELDPGPPLIAYGLDTRGVRLLQRTDPAASLRELARWNKAHTRRTSWFLEHNVMISDFRCSLELATRGRGVELGVWEQGTGRRGTVPGSHDQSRPVRIAPDAYFELRQSGRRRHFFLEVDRATEEHDRLLRKFTGYWWYLQSREYRDNHQDPSRVNVLFVTTGACRLRNMIDTLSRWHKPNRATHGGKGLFWFCFADDYRLEDPRSILGPIWRTPSRRVHSLLLGRSPQASRAIYGK